jgi:glycosyltransferase involved in cell wall biosynthesis
MRWHKGNMANDRNDYDKNLVSVVIPAYNSRQWVKRAVDSVLRQTYPNVEAIVVDDGSTDGTFEYVKAHIPEVTLLQQPNQGVAAARNLGVKHSKGEFIAFLDADDIWAREKLRIQMTVFAKHPHCGLCATDAVAFYSTETAPELDTLFREPNEGVPTGLDIQSLFRENTINTSSAVVRRDVFFQAGQFDENLRRTQDYDLWLRICDTWKVYYLNIPLIGYQKTPGSLSADTLGRGTTMLQVFEKWLDKYPQFVKPRIAKYSLSVTRKLLRLGRVEEARNMYIKYYIDKARPGLMGEFKFFVLKLMLYNKMPK